MVIRNRRMHLQKQIMIYGLYRKSIIRGTHMIPV